MVIIFWVGRGGDWMYVGGGELSGVWGKLLFFYEDMKEKSVSCFCWVKLFFYKIYD